MDDFFNISLKNHSFLLDRWMNDTWTKQKSNKKEGEKKFCTMFISERLIKVYTKVLKVSVILLISILFVHFPHFPSVHLNLQFRAFPFVLLVLHAHYNIWTA